MATAGSGAVPCVVWEYQRDDGGYSPYSPDISAQIESAFKSGVTVFPTSEFTVNFNIMSHEWNSVPAIRYGINRATFSLSAAPSINAYWQWNNGMRFTVYSINASVDIELAFLRAEHSVDLLTQPCRIPYVIDFLRNEQIRHGYKTRRKIKRIQLSVPMQTLLKEQPASLPPLSTLLTASQTNPGTSVSAKSRSRKSKSGSSSSAAAKGASSSKQKSRSRAKPKSSKASSASIKLAESLDPRISSYVKVVTALKKDEDGPCPICLNQLSEVSAYKEDDDPAHVCPSQVQALEVFQLRRCKHMIHHSCLVMYSKSASKEGFQCPTCKKIYGVKCGDMPNGNMSVTKQSSSLPGHSGYGTIVITYSFKNGFHNGRTYRANGFPRTCYLPDSPKGQKILRLLRVAWERKLTFAIGTSVTTGATDTVVWNEIHHKTESTSNHSGHGYPDPLYLDNVLAELAAQGVCDNSDNSSEGSDSDY